MNLVYDFIENEFGKLIFPIERPKHTSNFSSFFIDYSLYCDGCRTFDFYAVQDKQLEMHTLYLINYSLFVVSHVTYGDIYFRADYISDTCEYIGYSQKIARNNKFLRLFPLDNDQLNYLCEYKKFFFVGFVDRSIDRHNEES
ncbi:hypothetical protein ABEH48_000220 [Yersinia enterocolitica]|uniref:hypothetical protein n=1 Tax=Yersinia enterocolitica TaxID=630 RepID=UPI0029ACFDA4|nr:hypothetical protein [Yersinia enterocolitica]ELW8237472.1 hypothetical protein [Yersinia enterocolitica]